MKKITVFAVLFYLCSNSISVATENKKRPAETESTQNKSRNTNSDAENYSTPPQSPPTNTKQSLEERYNNIKKSGKLKEQQPTNQLNEQQITDMQTNSMKLNIQLGNATTVKSLLNKPNNSEILNPYFDYALSQLKPIKEIIKIFVTCGANYDQKKSNNECANKLIGERDQLFNNVSNGHQPNYAQLQLSPVWLKNESGETVLDIATKNNNFTTVQTLLPFYGSQPSKLSNPIIIGFAHTLSQANSSPEQQIDQAITNKR